MSTAAAGPPMPLVRLLVRVRGVVQGVGFRPFVHALAHAVGVAGFVGNDGDGVFIEVEGEAGTLASFIARLRDEAPPLAHIESVEQEAIAVLGSEGFRIVPSAAPDARATPISPDVATCERCLQELRDPADRRFRYPFINCTHCGPRFTITCDVPYDRAATTMATFAMCQACQREYDDPASRRFHAQPNACPRCGPRLSWRVRRDDAPTHDEDALQRALDVIASGGVVAVKGIGGFHLACDATSDAAVARLRQRKHRHGKPLALLMATLDAVRLVATVSDDEARLLETRARPIVLLQRRPAPDLALAPDIAPGVDTLGVLLPYSPLHHLLAERGPLVLTSGNISEEPIARDDEEGFARLAHIADGFLTHDRAIHVVADDSVVRIALGGEYPVRRSRGYAPFPVRLTSAVTPVLAVGAELKAAACLTRGAHAFLTPHVGDVGNLETMAAMERACAHMERIFRVAPERIACDLHPDLLSSRWAERLAASRSLPLVRVQHHHAHLASLMAEHQREPDAPLLAFTFDGTGFGPDQTIWGGEALVGDARGFTRVAHLATAPLPGGDAAVRHPSRIALARLSCAGVTLDPRLPPVRATSDAELRVLRRQLERRLNCVDTSSMGRFLDAVSSLLGLRHAARYEGEAAIALEQAARGGVAIPGFAPFSLHDSPDAPMRFDGAPILADCAARLLRGESIADLARSVHEAIADVVLAIARRVRERQGIATAGLTGGVFQNLLLLDGSRARLLDDGFTVLTHRLVPANDGGIALGQALVAAHAEGAT